VKSLSLRSPASLVVRTDGAARKLASLAYAVCVGAPVFFANVAHACSSCVDPRDTTRAAMITGTIALSLLPLGFIGGVAAWIWRANKSDDEQQ
jgi:hypothetical protein